MPRIPQAFSWYGDCKLIWHEAHRPSFPMNPNDTPPPSTSYLSASFGRAAGRCQNRLQADSVRATVSRLKPWGPWTNAFRCWSFSALGSVAKARGGVLPRAVSRSEPQCTNFPRVFSWAKNDPMMDLRRDELLAVGPAAWESLSFWRGAPGELLRNAEKTWVCLKIVYPYTQWLMIIIPTKWL